VINSKLPVGTSAFEALVCRQTEPLSPRLFVHKLFTRRFLVPSFRPSNQQTETQFRDTQFVLFLHRQPALSVVPHLPQRKDITQVSS